jgi:hypothetical protein
MGIADPSPDIRQLGLLRIPKIARQRHSEDKQDHANKREEFTNLHVLYPPLCRGRYTP